MSHPARAVWLAGTRSEVLHLGPLFKSLRPRERGLQGTHAFVLLGEQGTAAIQAVDFLELCPDESSELRYLAEDPAIRLHSLLKDIEEVIRRRRATHVLFSGFGPVAAAASLVCHGRQCRGLWLRPADPAGLIPRLRWESGLEHVITSLRDTTSVVEAREGEGEGERELSPEGRRTTFPSGRRESAPLAMIAITRMLWGMQGVMEQVVSAVGAWARSMPEVDWLLLRTLDPRLEGPLASMPDRPENLLSVPPLPYPEYRALLEESRVALTDSCNVAAEFLNHSRPVVALGELAAQSTARSDNLLSITPAELLSEGVKTFLSKAMRRPLVSISANSNPSPSEVAAVASWLTTERIAWP